MNQRAIWLSVLALGPALGLAAGPEVRAQVPNPLSVLAPEVFPADKEAPKDAELEKAVETFRRLEFGPALEALKAAAQKNPALPPPKLMLARLLLGANQRPQARAYLEQAAAEAPDYPGTYLAFGTLAASEGRLTDTLLHCEKAFALTKAGKWTDGQRKHFLAQYHAGLATVAEGRKDWKTAESSLKAFLETEPANGKIRQRLARALFNQNNETQALKELERSAKDDSSLPPAPVALGWMYSQKGDQKSASVWMDRAIKEAPGDPRTHLSVGAWDLQQGNLKEAKGRAFTAASRDPNAKDLRMLRGLIARYEKDYPEAEAQFQAMYNESPGDFQVANQLALVLAEQDDATKRGRALQLAENNYRAHPASMEALVTLGRVYYRLGRLDEAERAFQASAAGGTMSSEAAYYFAQVMNDRKRPDAVKALLKAAVETPGNFPSKQDARAWLDKLDQKTDKKDKK